MSWPSWAAWRSIGAVVVDHVTVATSTALPLDVAGFDELGQDSLRGSTYAQANLGVAGDAQQDLRVVGDELPALTGRLV